MRSLTALWAAASALALFPGGVLGGGGKMELPPVTVRYIVQGAYEVRKSGSPAGREDFIRTYMSNNTVVYESVFDVIESKDVTVSGNNKLEIEEDSGFPSSYYTSRRVHKSGGETGREVSVHMYANVAVVSERQGDDEKRRIVELPTGCLFVEGNIAHHIAAVLDRYDREAGGKQTFRAFDPLGVGTTDVSVELVGDTTFVQQKGASTGASPSGEMVHYRYFAGASQAVDVFADRDTGIIRVIDAPSSETEYVLLSIEKRMAEDPSQK
jgi:hypothetical protein